MENAAMKVAIEQKGRSKLICANADIAMAEAIRRQFPRGWADGWVPPLYAKELPRRIKAGELVSLGACDKATVWMYDARYPSKLAAQIADL
jgi:hypothetical protein